MRNKKIEITAYAAAGLASFGLFSGFSLFKVILDRDNNIYSHFFNKINGNKALKNGGKNHNSGYDFEYLEKNKEWFENQKTEDYELISADGLKLKASLLKSENNSDVFVLCVHSYHSDGKRNYKYIAKFYHDLGFNVFMPDNRASGKSEGKYMTYGYYESKDTLEWINFLIRKFGKEIRIILQGNSMGAASVMMLSGNENLPENVKFIVEDCGFKSAPFQLAYNLRSMGIPDFPTIKEINLFCKLIADFDLNDCKPVNYVKKSKVPILFIHGGNDKTAPVSMAIDLYEHCPNYKDILIVEKAGHDRSYLKDPKNYELRIKNFCDKFLDNR